MIISIFFYINTRSSIDWSLVRIKAAETVGQLVAQIPEFNDMCRLPFCSVKVANVLPIRLRYVKYFLLPLVSVPVAGGSIDTCRNNLSRLSGGSKRLKRKSLGRMPAEAVAQSFLAKRRYNRLKRLVLFFFCFCFSLAVTRMFLCTGGLLQARGQLIQVLYLTFVPSY
jgi:hypothetical protein